MHPKLIAALVFLTVYAMLILHKGKPPLVVWSGATLLLVARVITPSETTESINVNVLGIS